jgi:ribonuclease Z
MRSLRKVAFVCAFLFVAVFDAALAQDMKVTLLGTGSPPPVMNRFGPSILVEAGDKKFLFDVGRGAMQRLAQTKTRWQDVDGVFSPIYTPTMS